MDRLASIEAFVTTVRFESFTKAADHLRISPAALSRAVSNLEAHTQFTLLHRSSRHVALAEEARDYFALCVDLLERLHDGEQRLIRERNGCGGLLRIAAHPLAIEAGLPKLISQFRSNTPEVSVIVSTASTPLRLEYGTCDVAVYAPELIADSSAVYRPLLRSPIVLVASRSYIRKRRVPSSRLDFSNDVMMVSGVATDGVDALRFKGPTGAEETSRAAVTMLVDGPEAIRLALAGYGMALVPEFLVSALLAEGHLQLALPGYQFAGEPVELGVGFTRRRTMPRRMRDFIDACVAHFGGMGAVTREKLEPAAA
jgi:DNA-binding transcriptional LysR family regulator